MRRYWKGWAIRLILGAIVAIAVIVLRYGVFESNVQPWENVRHKPVVTVLTLESNTMEKRKVVSPPAPTMRRSKPCTEFELVRCR